MTHKGPTGGVKMDTFDDPRDGMPWHPVPPGLMVASQATLASEHDRA